MKKHWFLTAVMFLLVLCFSLTAAAEDEVLKITSVSVNGQIPKPHNGADFVPQNLIDGRSDTCWQVRLNKGFSLSDLYVDLTLEKPSAVNQLWIKNGFWRFTNGYNQYIRNSRVKTLAVSVQTEGSNTFSAPISFELENLPRWMEEELPDSDWLRFDLGGTDKVVKIRLTILAIHKGNRYPDDIAISEVQLMGKISGYSDYTVRFSDQDGNPVPNVSIMMMGSNGAQTMVSDAEGKISFSGKPEAYRIFITAMPAGYEADMLQGYELAAEGGELQIAATRQ